MTIAVTTILPDGSGETTIPASAWLSVSAGRRINGIGSSSLRIRKNDIPAGAMAAGRLVRVYDDATLLAAFRPQQPTSELTDTDTEQGNRIVNYPGVDVMQILDAGAVWWPDGVSDAKKIWVGWPSPGFDDSPWTAPLSWGTVDSQPLPSYRPVGAPAADQAELITSAAAYGQTERDDFYRATFTLPGAERVRISFAGDDGYDVLLESALIGSRRGPNNGEKLDYVEYNLGAGTFQLAARVHNEDRGSNSTNVTWFYCVVQGLETGTVYLVTNTTDWVHLSDPATVPGLTARALARIILEGPQGRGATVLDNVVIDGTDTLDPDGNPYTVEHNLQLSVMADLAEVFTDRFRDIGIETVMTPNLHLQVWDVDGAGTDQTGTIDLRSDDLLLPGSTWAAAREVASVFGRLDKDGRWVEHVDATLEAAHGRVEREWEYAAVTPDFTVAQAFEDFNGQREHATFMVRRSDLPAGVDLGDLVDGELTEGAAGTWRIEGIDVGADSAGEAMLTILAVSQ